MIAEHGSEMWPTEDSIGECLPLSDYPTTKRVLVEQCAQQMVIDQPDIDLAELAYMQRAEIESLLMLPMIFQGQVIGLIEIMDDWASRTFSDQEVELAQLLANQAANAIENARLYKKSAAGSRAFGPK